MIKKHLVTLVKEFKGGRLENFYSKWAELTSDPEILDMIRGMHIDFDSFDNCVADRNVNYNLTDMEIQVINQEVSKLLSKGVISPCAHSLDQNISPVFTCPKKDGTHRMILNLKAINVDVSYKHFKMDTFQSALLLITPNCFMASIDLKDAYYSVSIDPAHRRFLRFKWNNTLYQFNALPNGLSPAPRKFTKLLKPVFAKLRASGHDSTAFIDDSLLVSLSYDSCLDNILATTELFLHLGFVVHPDKSVFKPSQRIIYLGFIIDSVKMMVFLTQERTDAILELIKASLRSKCILIRDLASLIGKLIASFPAVCYGPLHFRLLEDTKKEALKASRGDFDVLTVLSDGAREELNWWMDNLHTASKSILSSEPDISIETDASMTGWGCVCNNISAGGVWLPEEAEHHINYLELLAAYIALQCYEDKLVNKHVRLYLDNSTAVACINKMGTSHSFQCNQVTYLMWMWCIDRHIWISAAHIPGKDNKVADAESRNINLDAEWKLNSNFLEQALEELDFLPEMDLFASRLNFQFANYVSYKPDPDAVAVDAFSFSWKDINFYAFPPFSILHRVLKKVLMEKAQGILVVPDWPTQVWWPLLLRLLVQKPWELPARDTILYLPSCPRAVHPLLPKLRLLACRISARD